LLVRGQARHIQSFYAAAVNERILLCVGPADVQVYDVAKVVVECPENFRAQTQVQRQVTPHLPVVLGEHREIVGSVLMGINPAAAKTEGWRPHQEPLEVGEASEAGVDRVHPAGENKLPVEDLREDLIQIDPRSLASECQDVRTMNPTQRLHRVVIVLRLVLVGKGRRADLKSRTIEGELIDRLRHVVRGTVDSELGRGYWIDVIETVVDAHEPNP